MAWWDDLPHGETVDGDDPYDTQSETLRVPDPYKKVAEALDLEERICPFCVSCEPACQRDGVPA